MKKSRQVIFLDFDGVLCDSIDECFVTSWLAFYGDLDRWNSISVEDRRLFASLRPFVRTGADFMALQFCVHRKITIRKQSELDAEMHAIGKEKMAEYERRFYAVRKDLLENRRSYWLALNRPFPKLLPALKSAAGSGSCRILSTKRPEYVREILRSWGISWSAENTYDSGAGRKETFISRCLDEEGSEAAILVDDQIDHFLGMTDPRIEGYLASWGYVMPEWLVQGTVPVIDQGDLVALLHEYV